MVFSVHSSYTMQAFGLVTKSNWQWDGMIAVSRPRLMHLGLKKVYFESEITLCE